MFCSRLIAQVVLLAFALVATQTEAQNRLPPPNTLATMPMPPTLPQAPNDPAWGAEVIDAPYGMASPPADDGFLYHLGAVGRGYLFTDSRIAFSGQETSFAAEGVVFGDVEQQIDDWQVGCRGEFYLNQPFDRNLLVDSPERASFRGNFEIDPFQISQLHVGARRGDFYAALGKFITPFGRWYFPLYLNSWQDAPFIRTEAILWRETGLMLQYEPESWSFTVAITNGGPDQDANSSKAGIARLAYQTENFVLGMSGKKQDGIGSEGQKTFNNYYGMDMMIRSGPIHLSAEAIYNEYGYRRPFDPLQITWGRSIYGRDLNYAWHQPLTGVGYYLNLGCDGRYWNLTVNYGEFYPKQIGDAMHDETKRRGLLKCVYHWSPNVDLFAEMMIENRISKVIPDSPQGNFFGLFGAQFML